MIRVISYKSLFHKTLADRKKSEMQSIALNSCTLIRNIKRWDNFLKFRMLIILPRKHFSHTAYSANTTHSGINNHVAQSRIMRHGDFGNYLHSEDRAAVVSRYFAHLKHLAVSAFPDHLAQFEVLRSDLLARAIDIMLGYRHHVHHVRRAGSDKVEKKKKKKGE